VTDLDRAIPPELAPPRLDDPALAVTANDVLVALVTFGGSLGVLAYGLSAAASLWLFMLGHCIVLTLPARYLTVRVRAGGDITVPLLLLVATFATGPVGALGCAGMALGLWLRRPSPARLQHWYDYISGIVARSRLTRIYDELVSGRLPSDPTAEVPRFRPLLHGASVEEQQRVLGVIGRRYHADFRPALRNALRNKNGFIRAQAAAVASRLSIEEKNRLWSANTNREETESGREQPDQPAADVAPDALDVEARRP
jgi:hypothetical protein